MNSNWYDKLTDQQLYDLGYNSASGLTPEETALDVIPDGIFGTLAGAHFCDGFDDYRAGLAPRKLA